MGTKQIWFPLTYMENKKKSIGTKTASQNAFVFGRKRIPYRFATAWEWINENRILIFGWTIPLRLSNGQICCINFVVNTVSTSHLWMHIIIYNNFRFGCHVLQRARFLKTTLEFTEMTFIQMHCMDQWNGWPQITQLIYSNWVDTQIHMHRDIKRRWRSKRFTLLWKVKHMHTKSNGLNLIKKMCWYLSILRRAQY